MIHNRTLSTVIRTLAWLIPAVGILLTLASVSARQEPIVSTKLQTQPLPPNQFLYKEFTNATTSTLALAGSASLVSEEGVIRLTNDITPAQAGSMWYRTKQQVSDGFDTTFDFQITKAPSSTEQADGLAFVIHNDPRGIATVGTSGCELGYGSIARGLAVEFDTYSNSNPRPCKQARDPNGNHVGILTGKTGVLHSYHVAGANLGTRMLPDSNKLRDGFHTARISYLVEEHAPTGVLQVYIDDMITPFLTTTLNLSETLGLSDGRAWVGLVAGTGTILSTHDIGNWFFVDQWDLSCATYDFVRAREAAQGFIPDPYPSGASWPLEGQSWISVAGRLGISRGIINHGMPILAPTDLIDQRLRRLIQQHRPIRAIPLEFTWTDQAGNAPNATDQLHVSFDLKVGNRLISGSQVLSVLDTSDQDGRFKIRIPLNEMDIPTAIKPTGLRVILQSSNSSHALRLHSTGVCLDAGVPDRPGVVPPGGREACANLQAYLKTRRQPFGPNGVASQPELFASTTDKYIRLTPFPDYSIGVKDYPTSMTFHTVPPGHVVVPCAFTKRGAFYNPTAPTIPIVRFTALGNDPHWRESLILLNYAAYFSRTLTNWCAFGDTVYPDMDDRAHTTKFTPGYNVPAPRYKCAPTSIIHTGRNDGPCGTFVGSLFRAMGYFNVQSFAANIHSPGVLSALGNLYYGAIGYNRHALANENYYAPVPNPLVRVDTMESERYYTQIVQFEGIRVYPHLNNERMYDTPNDETDPYQISWGWWWNDTVNPGIPIAEIVPAPQDKTPVSDPLMQWRMIKPGDIAITVVERTEDVDLDLHIAIVVGWGPQQFTPNAWRGENLHPTYQPWMNNGGNYAYVPYVMDRFSLPGTGEIAGPRPFNYRISHTATDFWISSYSMTMTSPAPQTTTTSMDSAATPVNEPLKVEQPSTTVKAPPIVDQVNIAPSLDWNTQTQQIAIGGAFGVRITDPTLTQVVTWPTISGVTDLEWNHTGTAIAIAEAAQQVTIRDQTGALIGELTGMRSMPTKVAWNPNDTQLATVSHDPQLLIWNTESWRVESTITYTGTDRIRAIAWNPEENLLAGSDSHQIFIWDADGLLQQRIPLGWSPQGTLAWSHDGQSLITAGGQHWSIQNAGQSLGSVLPCSAGTDISSILNDATTHMLSIGIAADGFHACIQSISPTGQVLPITDLDLPVGMPAITDGAWNTDQTQIALITSNGIIQLWDRSTGTVLKAQPLVGMSVETLNSTVRTCIPHDRTQIAVLHAITQGNFVSFVSIIQAHHQRIDSTCVAYLSALGEAFQVHPPTTPTVEPPTPQPMTGVAWCKTNTRRGWLLRNPNPFHIRIGWGWANQGLSENGIILPAARDGVAGTYPLITPINGPLYVQSGSTTITIPWKTSVTRQCR
ncbi:MAG: hypothetical protein LCH85_17480 [Chloroflexi bacterium]|nr:hypothetical protein [Chloroflexota bacterium]